MKQQFKSTVSGSKMLLLRKMWIAVTSGTDGLERSETLFQEWWTERNKRVAGDPRDALMEEAKWGRSTEDFMKETEEVDLEDDAKSDNLVALARSKGLPIKWLPNVRRTRIIVNKVNWLMKIFGLTARLPARLEYTNWKNRKINRYLAHQWLRLDKVRVNSRHDNPKLYWAIADSLMKTTSYMTSALNHVFKGWHRNLPYWKVLDIARKTRSLIDSKATNLEYHRVYIPKADGGSRPLGVPSAEWRVYLHMQAQLYQLWLKGMVGRNYAYQQNLGSHSAWRYIVDKVIDAPDIYEFDLKNFFGSVKIDYLIIAMYRYLKLDKERLARLKMLLSQNPSLPKDYEMGNISALQYLKEEYVLKRKSFKANQPNYDDLLPFEEATEAQKEYFIKTQGVVPFVLKRRTLTSSPIGVPQGAAISPILAIFALSTYMKEVGLSRVLAKKQPTNHSELLAKYQTGFEDTWQDNILYADDGLIFGRKPRISLSSIEEIRAEIAEYRKLRDEQHFKELEIVKKTGKSSFTFAKDEDGNSATGLTYEFKENSRESKEEVSKPAPLKGKARWRAYREETLSAPQPVAPRGVHFGKHPPMPPRTPPKVTGYDSRPANKRVDELFVQYPSGGPAWDYVNSPERTTPDERSAVFDSGIEINRKKSGWVKKDGVWLKPLKFLGLVYDPFKKVIRAQTRNGSTLEFSDFGSAIHHLYKYADEFTKEKSSGLGKTPPSLKNFFSGLLGATLTWKDLFRGRFTTFFISRMYQGSWNIDVDQDFTMKFEKGSWMDVKCAHYFDQQQAAEVISVFNSSSFAVHCLANDLKGKKKYQHKINWLATVAFGTKLALQKIHRVLSGKHRIP